MKFADLHCDTPFELYCKNEHIASNNLHIALDKSNDFEKYVQVAAIWSNSERDNNTCYKDFFEIYNNFNEQAGCFICKNSDQLKNSGKTAFVMAVEDARIFDGDVERLHILRDMGVRLVTLTWKDVTCIGGSWNTDEGLTEFGRCCVEEMLRTGVIPDVSHGSKKLVSDVYSIAKACGKTFCATHSNSYAVCDHCRNLTDDNARLIAECGGIIGISLFLPHLSQVGCSVEDVIRHIDHYISLVGEDAIAFGCDFDGVSSLPIGINDITSIKYIFSACSRKFGENISEKIFFNNTFNFLLNNI